MRLLLIEDDIKLSSFIIKGLIEHGFVVEHAKDGEEGFYMALRGNYDAAIVDIMLPKKDGFTIIEDLRKQESQLPILVLSAKRSLDERVKGLQTGSDDYLTKPFAFVELLARIQALIRRSSFSNNIHEYKVADLTLNRLTYEVFRGEKKIELKPKEFSLLEYLMQNEGKVVSRTMLMDHIWDFQFDSATNVIDVHICRLREKIDKDFPNKLLHTIRGVGYVLREENN